MGSCISLRKNRTNLKTGEQVEIISDRSKGTTNPSIRIGKPGAMGIINRQSNIIPRRKLKKVDKSLYIFQNITNMVVCKENGDIDGNPFSINDCKDSTICLKDVNAGGFVDN